MNVEDNNFSYLVYKKLVDYYIKVDPRELNFQNRIIVSMLEKLLINTDIDVVDTSTLFYRGKKNPKNLDNSQFQAPGFAPPDILLARNWNMDNINNKVEYLCAIEIKSPISREKICGINFEEYHQHVKRQMKGHLSVHTKVILTDCYRWQFFEGREGFVNTPPIDLVDVNKQWIGVEDKRDTVEPKEWYQLINKIFLFFGVK